MKLVNSLGAEKALPLSLRLSREPLSLRVPAVGLVGGAVVTGGSTPEPKEYTLEGSLLGASRAALQAELDDWAGFLRHAPLKFYRRGDNTRYLEVYPKAFEPEWLAVEEVGLSLSLYAPDPLWKAEIQGSVFWLMGNTGEGGINPGGNAPVYPVIKLTGRPGGSPNPSLTNLANGATLAYSGTLADGEAIELDCERRTAKNLLTSANALHLMSSGFLVGFYLNPSANTLRIGLGAGAVIVEVFWRSRWY